MNLIAFLLGAECNMRGLPTVWLFALHVWASVDQESGPIDRMGIFRLTFCYSHGTLESNIHWHSVLKKCHKFDHEISRGRIVDVPRCHDDSRGARVFPGFGKSNNSRFEGFSQGGLTCAHDNDRTAGQFELCDLARGKSPVAEQKITSVVWICVIGNAMSCKIDKIAVLCSRYDCALSGLSPKKRSDSKEFSHSFCFLSGSIKANEPVVRAAAHKLVPSYDLRITDHKTNHGLGGRRLCAVTCRRKKG